MRTTDAFVYLLDLASLNRRTELGRALEVVLTELVTLEGERDEALRAHDAAAVKIAMTDELTRMHAELSVQAGNAEAAHTRHVKTFQDGIREIAEIVWDTSTKSSDRIRRLQEHCVPREYLEQLGGVVS